MRTVWVLRHAKAAPHSPRDHERPLSGRGRRQCAEVAAHLTEMAPSGLATILTSSAQRARETAELVLGGLSPGAEIVVESALYQAEPEDVVELLRSSDDDRSQLMVVGHNPTLLELVLLLLEPGGAEQLGGSFPTAALAVVETEADRWEQLGPAKGRLEHLFIPSSR